jgi:hypothetical protein
MRPRVHDGSARSHARTHRGGAAHAEDRLGSAIAARAVAIIVGRRFIRSGARE